MELEIKKLDTVWTSDQKKLGLAQHLFHREDEVDPDLLLYATYLEVSSYEYGEIYYVPTEYISEQDQETGNVFLSVDFKTVLGRTWGRMPDFLAHGQGRQEFLPER